MAPGNSRSSVETHDARSGDPSLGLSSQEFLQGIHVCGGKVGVALGAHTVAAGDGILRLREVQLHALLTLCHVAAEAVAVARLLSTQGVETTVHRAGAG